MCTYEAVVIWLTADEDADIWTTSDDNVGLSNVDERH